ncbi:MAG TPA: adenylosuccinate synthase [Thermomicrobiales bacterium]|nr:adenylosuccinate synthase [Thermomicrobiales bacterium]
MPVAIVLGGQWGDEGKGKIIDALANGADVVIRANGGANAGHTVVTDKGVFKFHLIPSGILHPECLCIIGAGVSLNPRTLLEELSRLDERGIDSSNLRVSSRCHLIMPYHPVLDRLEEANRGDDMIGTTQTGNGPCYADKAARRGIRLADITDPEHLSRSLAPVLAEKNAILEAIYNHPPFDLNEIAEEFAAYGERLAPYLSDVESDVQDAIDSGANVIVEGAQAAMLDIDYGTYPFVTSSSPTAAGVCQGAGIAPTQVGRVIGVYKAYLTRVGAGGFPTELHDETGHLLRERGVEYGTTTGRPRRTGWFDGVQARYTARLNGVNEVALTKFDVLDGMEMVRVCTGYRLDGKALASPPARITDYDRVEPIYEDLAGWSEDTSATESVEDLPPAARAYLSRVEELIGVPIRYIGVGPHRRQLLDSAIAAD